MQLLRPTKKHHYLLLFLIAIIPLLFGIAYVIGFDKSVSANVTMDRASNTAINNTVPSPTWQHTTGNFSNRILVVTLHYTGFNSPSVSYNGIPLTRATNHAYAPGVSLSYWYLVNPPVGTYNITTNAGALGAIIGGAQTFYNVDQTNPISLHTTRGGLGLGPSVNASATINGTNVNQVIVDTFILSARSNSSWPPNPTVGTGQTRRWLTYLLDPADGDRILFSGSTKQGTANSTATSWTATGVTDNIWGYAAIALNPPAVIPTPTSPPTPTATPTPGPVTGNIININFGITNLQPWIQSICGDIRVDNGLTNLQPEGQSTIITNASCASPGVIFSGNARSSFGQGQPSSTNWVVGGNTYPEVYSPSNSGGIFTSYTYLSDKAQTTDAQPINLATICNISSCTLPNNLASGVYQATSDVQLNAYTFPVNRHYVFLIGGNLTIRGNVLTPMSSSSVFSVSGNIIVPPTVGSTAAVTTANLSGIFSTDRSFILQGNNNCTDLRLNIEGTLIVNAGRTGGSLQNNRDLCGNNATAPTIQLTQRLDYVLNLPDFVRLQRTTLEEVAP